MQRHWLLVPFVLSAAFTPAFCNATKLQESYEFVKQLTSFPAVLDLNSTTSSNDAHVSAFASFLEEALQAKEDYADGHKRLGSGAKGAVFLVKKTSDQKLFALKVTLPHPDNKEASETSLVMDTIKNGGMSNVVKTIEDLDDCPEFIYTLHRQAQKAREAKGLKPVRDVQFECIVLEYCDKGDMFDQALKINDRAPRAPDSQQILKWFIDSLRGLSELHSRGLVHRDLKPENVFLVTETETKPLEAPAHLHPTQTDKDWRNVTWGGESGEDEDGYHLERLYERIDPSARPLPLVSTTRIVAKLGDTDSIVRLERLSQPCQTGTDGLRG
eukprot:Cvel_17289.t1-p1 / transcript=Cvel_17289.t1 / gene=Cvel_17289 / organism=Chromera_velia_CCMP2878 / gene_product=Interferon-induced, double-stranded RNA-activated, putative / transcript_product=Interferon-induced, double-stranded RNA-activated, putative / location=Cvel_scaffold1372:5760-9550(+) / protein_length=327 / sequence_SO=supercontig / SO=protein_coding / is_pseudo=false